MKEIRRPGGCFSQDAGGQETAVDHHRHDHKRDHQHNPIRADAGQRDKASPDQKTEAYRLPAVRFTAHPGKQKDHQIDRYKRNQPTAQRRPLKKGRQCVPALGTESGRVNGAVCKEELLSHDKDRQGGPEKHGLQEILPAAQDERQRQEQRKHLAGGRQREEKPEKPRIILKIGIKPGQHQCYADNVQLGADHDRIECEEAAEEQDLSQRRLRRGNAAEGHDPADQHGRGQRHDHKKEL